MHNFMRHHDRIHTTFLDKRTVGCPIDSLQLALRAVQIGFSAMRIDAYITQTWKMLERTEYLATLLQPFQISLSHFRNQRRVAAISAIIKLRVIYISDIDHRSKIQIKPIRCQVVSILDARCHCHARIIGPTNYSSGWTGTIQCFQAVYRSTLLIDGNHQGNGTIALHLLDKPFELHFIDNIIVGIEQQNSPDMVLTDHRAYVQRISWTKKLDNHHLAELLIECHILYNQVDILLGGHLRRWLCCRPRSETIIMLELIVYSSEQIIVACVCRPSNYEGPTLGTNKLCITSIDGIQDKYQEQT